MRQYTQLTEYERYQIYALMKAEHTQDEIAANLGRSKATLSRELRRNRGLRGYRPKQAQRLATHRRQGKATQRIDTACWAAVAKRLRSEWSPEQISGYLRVQRGVRISPEWIYQYVLADKRRGGNLYQHLRCHGKRRKRYGQYDRRGQLCGRTPIAERPAVVAARERLGDWEADTVIGAGHSGALVTLTERSCGLSLFTQTASKHAATVTDAIIRLLAPLKGCCVHTVTADNGKEFAQHADIAAALEADFYFADPYASWQRGTNENTNGLIRQYFPKHRNFRTITNDEVRQAMDKLNNRPRKRLGYKTPNQVLFGINPPVALTS